MRLWTLHPKHLDRQGLVALWRESLLAKAVLTGHTRGYKHHPQLERFRGYEPALIMDQYLVDIWHEADLRGYKFDRTKVDLDHLAVDLIEIPVSQEQVMFEAQHLARKVALRSPDWELDCENVELHPMFVLSDKVGLEDWERGIQTVGRGGQEYHGGPRKRGA